MIYGSRTFPPIHLGQRMGQGIPIFNKWHPLAPNCLAAYMPAAFPGGRVVNMATPGLGDLTSRTGPTVTLAMTPDGAGVPCAAASGVSGVTGPCPTSSAWRQGNSQSVFVRAMKTATATANTPTLLLGVAGNSTPFNSFGFGFGGTAGTGNTVTAYQTSVSGAQAGSIVPPINQMFDVLMTFPPTSIAPGADMWVNGIHDTPVDPTAVAVSYPGTVTIQMGNTTVSTRNPCATITTGYIWSGLLNAAAADYLHQNPYCLWLWPMDLVMAELVGTTTTTPNNGPQSPFLSPLTVGLGGAAAAERWLARRKLAMRRLRGK